MVYSYGFSQTGLAHEKNGTVCQDAHSIDTKKNGICIAAVADGLGSEAHSDISSQMVSMKAVEYCAEKITPDMSDEVLDIIKESFEYSWNLVEKYVEDNHEDILQYDTTLSLCVLINGRLYFGHSGDGGIIAMTDEGKFVPLTKQQRDEDGHVFPLCFGPEYWFFNKADYKVVSVLLATDGIYELFFPIYIRGREISSYNALIKFFIDPYPFVLSEVNNEELINKRKDYLLNLPEDVVSDDKTIVVLIDGDIPYKLQDDSYYSEPNWEELITEWRQQYNQSAYGEVYDDE